MSTLYSIPAATKEGKADFAHIHAGTQFFRELDPYRLYLKYDETKIPDWQLAARHIWCPPGKVVVEMLQAPEKIGELYIPDRMRETYNDEDTGDPICGLEPSVGIVLAVGDEAAICAETGGVVSARDEQGNPVRIPLNPGDYVLVVDGDGVEFESFEAGPYKAMGKVRMYGIVVPEPTEQWSPPYVGYSELLHWGESIVAKLEGNMVIPLDRNILIRKDPFETQSEGGVIIPDVGQERTSKATAVRCGERCSETVVNDRFIYHPLCELDFQDSDDDDLRMIREETILCVVSDEPMEGGVPVRTELSA